LRIIDVSEPAHPVQVGLYNAAEYATEVAVAGKHVYVADRFSGLHIIDVTDPAHPAQVGFYNTPGEAQSVSAVGVHAYVGDRDGGLVILRFSLEQQFYLPVIRHNWP
jgi:hypothetical protein